MRRLHSILLVTLLVTLGLTGVTQAQDQSLYWDRFDVKITVLPNGDFAVEEIQTIVFTSGQFHFGYRNIPLARADEITDVQVWEGNRQYNQAGGGDYTFSTSESDGDLNIRWNFPYTSNSTHTYTLRYTVRGGLRYYPDGDQLFWKAVYADRDFPVYNSVVTVRLPEGATAGPVASYDTESTIVGEGGQLVTFTASETIDSGQEFEVRVQFPHGIVGGTAPSWQAGYDRRAEWDEKYKPALDLGLAVLGGFFLVGGVAALILWWYLRGRDPKVTLPATFLAEPPSDAPPGVAGTLVDEQADMEDIIATLVDLARRGFLVIREEQKAGILLGSSYDFTFALTGQPLDGLLPYERTLVNRVFGSHAERKLSALKDKFYKAIPKIQDQLYSEVVRRKYFRARPDQIRKRYGLIGIVLLIGIVAASFFAVAWLSDYTSTIVCPAIGLAVTALGIAIVGRFMPAKTMTGAEQSARWEAFKRYLQDIERYTDISQATEQFERYLPYAIAFGLEKSWMNKFTRLESTFVPMPIWYVPSYRRTGGSRAAGSASGAGRGAPSLQEMSDGMSSGLQNMSDGLTSMLNSASRTFASQPSSSGSGGGFSGGGRGGGGGGGGGGGFG